MNPPGGGGVESEMSASVEQSVAHPMIERVPAARRSATRAADPDGELVARWQQGETAAFEALVRRYEDRVFRLLHRMLGSAADAEDAAQETFLNLHRHGRRFRGDARFSTFVYRVAANAALNRRRSLGRRRARLERLAERQAAGHDLPTPPPGPEQRTLGRELQARVHEALETLPDKLRLPVVLFDIEGLAYAEVSEVLGVAEGTVKSRIHRARTALRERLAPGLRSPGTESTS